MADIPDDQTVTRGPAADITAYVPAANLTTRGQRQEARYTLRSGLRHVTSLKRLPSCGLPLGKYKDILARRKNDVHHFAGVSTAGRASCASVWSCPVCTSKIRHQRAYEVSRAVVSALDKGYSMLFVTRTIPHSAEDALAVTLSLLEQGRRYVMNQTVVKAARKAAGYIGAVAAKEITYGNSGWHPHTHDIELYEHELSLKHFADLSAAYYHYLQEFYSRSGFDGLSFHHGVRVEQVQLGGAALANYVTKVREGANIQLYTAHEVVRADLKRGRAGSLTPFDVACAFFQTGDMDALDLWHEYERESKGKSAIRFTKGLRARLLPHEPEKRNKELTDFRVGGVDVVRFSGPLYRKIARVPGLEGKVLTALDTGGFGALVELLTAYRLNEPGGYWRIDSEALENARQPNG